MTGAVESAQRERKRPPGHFFPEMFDFAILVSQRRKSSDIACVIAGDSFTASSRVTITCVLKWLRMFSKGGKVSQETKSR
jgi:hypothetical protein